MAIDSINIGSFIPNSSGQPEALTLPPGERAKLAAEKAKEKVAREQPAQTPAVKRDEDGNADAVAPSLGENVSIDV